MQWFYDNLEAMPLIWVIDKTVTYAPHTLFSHDVFFVCHKICENGEAV